MMSIRNISLMAFLMSATFSNATASKEHDERLLVRIESMPFGVPSECLTTYISKNAKIISAEHSVIGFEAGESVDVSLAHTNMAPNCPEPTPMETKPLPHAGWCGYIMGHPWRKSGTFVVLDLEQTEVDKCQSSSQAIELPSITKQTQKGVHSSDYRPCRGYHCGYQKQDWEETALKQAGGQPVLKPKTAANPTSQEHDERLLVHIESTQKGYDAGCFTSYGYNAKVISAEHSISGLKAGDTVTGTIGHTKMAKNCPAPKTPMMQTKPLPQNGWCGYVMGTVGKSGTFSINDFEQTAADKCQSNQGGNRVRNLRGGLSN